MPLHTSMPGSKILAFVQPKDGKFYITANGDTKEYQAIKGNLEMVRIEFDPGNPANKIQAYDAFIMHISDEETVYRIKMNVARNFTYSVARALGDIEKGQKIIAKAVIGSDPTITFCNMLKQQEDGSWVRPEIAELSGSTEDKVAFVKNVVESHPAYSVKVINVE